MPGRGAVGRALRVALRSEIQLPRVEPRTSGVSFLMNPRRQRVFEYVAREPGVHLRKAARELKIPTQSLRWHLRVLVRAGLLRETRLRGRAAYFCAGLTDSQDDAVLVCLQDPMNERILRLVSGSGTIPQPALIQRLGSYEQLVSPHLRWMTEAGLIVAAKPGGRKVLRPAPGLDAFLRRYQDRQEEHATWVLQTLQGQGLAPKVSTRSGGTLAVNVSSGRETATLRFDLIPVRW